MYNLLRISANIRLPGYSKNQALRSLTALKATHTKVFNRYLTGEVLLEACKLF